MKTQIRTSAEHLQLVLDARDKNAIGTTYKALNQLITKIKDCPYFSEPLKQPTTEESTVAGNYLYYDHCTTDVGLCID